LFFFLENAFSLIVFPKLLRVEQFTVTFLFPEIAGTIFSVLILLVLFLGGNWNLLLVN